MSTAPVENLEMRALEQRERIHRTALELISNAKRQLSISKVASDHLGSASLIVSVVAFLLGYAVTGGFTRR